MQTVSRPGAVFTSSGLRPSPLRAASIWKRFDVVLALAAVAIAAFGCLMIWTSTRDSLETQGLSGTYWVKKQIIFAAIGVAVMLVVAAIDYHRYMDWAWVIYGLTVLGLLGVYAVGHKANGSQAWYSLGSFQLEPSEFAKIGVLVVLAAVLGRVQGRVRLRTLATVLVLVAIPLLLVYKQPDLGTAIVLAVIVITMLAVGGVRPLHLGILTLVAILGVVGVVHFGVLKTYQKDRITAFLNTPNRPDAGFLASRQGSAQYNGALSKEAVSAGGVTGEGIGHGLLTNLGDVPEQYTDFIFSAVGEQVGLMGSVVFLLLFLVVIWRTWRISTQARDQFGTLLCVGVLAMLAFQVFENVGMAMGIMPIAGIPLPWTSYGGTAAIACFAGVGLVLNVRMRQHT
jgi:rod shape determining protein RodA